MQLKQVKEQNMSTVAEIQARIAADQKLLKEALKAERATALERCKELIKLHGFKTSDFKGLLKTRKRRDNGGEEASEGE
jgi:hypothetical protein